MTRTAIVTDSTSDLPLGLAADSLVTVVPLTVTIGGESLQDGVGITSDRFYERLAGSQVAVSTSQPPPGLFVEAYNRLLEDHDQVVSIHISEKLSGTLSSARQAAEIVDRPGQIHIIDSRGVSMQLGLLVLMAASLARAGADWESVVEKVTSARPQIKAFFTLATLEYLRRGGRIGRASALLGSVLQVKPVLSIEDGLVNPLERVRTHDRAVARLLDLARAVDTGQGVCAIIAHASEPEAADRIARQLEDISESLLIQSIGPVVGAHAGPGALGIGCYPAEVLPLGLKLAAGSGSSG